MFGPSTRRPKEDGTPNSRHGGAVRPAAGCRHARGASVMCRKGQRTAHAGAVASSSAAAGQRCPGTPGKHWPSAGGWTGPATDNTGGTQRARRSKRHVSRDMWTVNTRNTEWCDLTWRAMVRTDAGWVRGERACRSGTAVMSPVRLLGTGTPFPITIVWSFPTTETAPTARAMRWPAAWRKRTWVRVSFFWAVAMTGGDLRTPWHTRAEQMQTGEHHGL